MCYSHFVLTKLLKLGILLSTALRTVLIAKLVILGSLLLTSFILALSVVLVATLVMSVTLSSIFFTTYLNLPKSTGRDNNLSTLIYLLYKLLL